MQRYSSRDDSSTALDLMPDFQRWIENEAHVGMAYLVTWIAFNAIYVAEYDLPYAKFKIEKNGEKKFVNRYGYGLQMVDVDHVNERDMVLYALRKLPKAIRQQLLVTMSPTEDIATCLDFFAKRVPIWQGISIAQDAKGQLVRGVINVRETISADYPRWAFIDPSLLSSVLVRLQNGEDVDVPDRLLDQVGDILYTVRNNLFHGCKGSEDSNDYEVLENAYPLLKIVVDFFIGDNPAS